MILYSYMIKIKTVSPTKTFIEECDSNTLELLRKALTYNDTSVAFNLKKLNENKWLRLNKPHIFNVRKKELESNLSTCMLQYDSNINKYWFYPGSISYLTDFTFKETKEVEYPESHKVAWRKPLPFTLYPYQQESVDKLIEAKHGCVSLATGMGKTAVILTIARELGLKTVVVTPSKSIFLEILHKFEHHFGKNNVGAYGNGKKRIGKLFTICVSKSLTMLKEGTKEYEFFKNVDVVLGDECHTLAANTLEKVFHGVLKKVPYRFFLSGTIVRGDGKDKLLHSIVGKEVLNRNTKYAVEGGYVCPVKFLIFETTSQDTKKYKDPLKAKRKQFLYNRNIADISAKIANGAWSYSKESTLILVEELEQIRMLADRLKVPFNYVHSASKADAAKFGLETRKVDEAVESFNRGEVKVLIGTSCIATGTNMYCTHNTINWVGGSSEVKTKQGAIGRSVRVLENSKYVEFHKPKPFSKIYDFKISNIPLMEKHLKKRISMYKEVNNNIKYIKVG
jgi:superfamily II DNA or RNA helicase